MEFDTEDQVLIYLYQVETEWSDVMRQNVGIEVDQMEKVLITGITTQQIVDHK